MSLWDIGRLGWGVEFYFVIFVFRGVSGLDFAVLLDSFLGRLVEFLFFLS